jgi:hypothetical protein
MKIGYKVVTKDLQSLGLRNNPNIIKYPINRWYKLNNKNIIKGKQDFGGIWVASTLSGARKLSKYMKEKYNKEVRIFKSVLGNILYENSYRIKADSILLKEEIK